MLLSRRRILFGGLTLVAAGAVIGCTDESAVATTTYDDQGRITQAGFQFTDNDSITFLFLAMILQQGADYWADDGIHVNFQTDAAKKAFERLKKALGGEGYK